MNEQAWMQCSTQCSQPLWDSKVTTGCQPWTFFNSKPSWVHWSIWCCHQYCCDKRILPVPETHKAMLHCTPWRWHKHVHKGSTASDDTILNKQRVYRGKQLLQWQCCQHGLPACQLISSKIGRIAFSFLLKWQYWTSYELGACVSSCEPSGQYAKPFCYWWGS